ncbi:hypothetical protein [Bosea sp. ASV33]|uniref:hypothetical protein n=1 Tax=Bosea sp. ASV33 TaxID=2795106 RepID=UPI001AEE6200|nr:hypothetical protein [Bosea sp. ASV33]
MPTLDVSEILDDPEFADTATVYRNAVTVDPVTGRTTVTTTSTAILCVVTSDKGRNLQRNPQAALSEGSIIVHSTFTFTEGGNGVDADELDWRGRKWTVVVVDDYSRYGAGFTCATCRLLDLR